MDDEKTGKRICRGIAIGFFYCVAFHYLWAHSVDQWYLPAGLRLATLLLVPMRYWLYVLAGDVAALLVIRIPKAGQYTVQWAYLSPLLFMSIYALVPYWFRKRLTDTRSMVQWLPAIAIITGIVTSGWVMYLNYMLHGPRPDTTLDKYFVRFVIGDYFGIMIVMLICLLWLQRKEWRNTRHHIVRSIVIAILAIAALYAAAIIPGIHGLTIRFIPLALMLIAIAYLTILHGWHGAATGTLLVCFAIAFALPRIKIVGSTDDVVLMAQIVLAIASSLFLLSGVHFSKLHERSGDSLRNELLIIQLQQQHKSQEAETMGGVRAVVQSFERRFRGKALVVAYARDDLDSYRHAVAKALKDEGLYQQAMDAISTGVESARALVRHTELLYPLEIETQGLYAVLTSEAFEEPWLGRARLRYALLGRSPRYLSLPLQLVAYRAVCSAMDTLATMEPTEFTIQTRGWRRRGRIGITIFVDCMPTKTFSMTEDVQLALQELSMLARAYDGTFKRRHTHRIGFLISEPQLAP